MSNLRISTFDKYNPFTIKGSSPAYLAELMFDTLLWPSLDETATGYGLLAEDVQAAPTACRPRSGCGRKRAFTTASPCWLPMSSSAMTRWWGRTHCLATDRCSSMWRGRRAG